MAKFLHFSGANIPDFYLKRGCLFNRKIFNDLSSDPAATLAVSKIEEESNSSDDNPEAGDAGSDLTNSAGAVTLIQDSSGTGNIKIHV